MKNQIIFFAFTLVIIFSGCSKESELRESVFITDPDHAGLPIYSEWGYNTFGAYYDRETFRSNSYDVPLKVSVTNDSTYFSFTGQKGGYGYDDNVSLKFIFPDYNPEEYFDLIELDDTTFDLVDSGCRVRFKFGDAEYDGTVLEGYLQFKRAQQLLVDEEQVEVILSGLFEFKILVDSEPVSITDGRFDIGVGYHNFFVY